jgi:LysM repeat protein
MTQISTTESGVSTGGLRQLRHVRPLRAIHNVKPGETIDSIASQYSISTMDLIRNNAHTLGTHGIVHAGMRLEV